MEKYCNVKVQHSKLNLLKSNCNKTAHCAARLTQNNVIILCNYCINESAGNGGADSNYFMH